MAQHELLQFFVTAHLADSPLKAASEPFGVVARAIDACEVETCEPYLLSMIEKLAEHVSMLPANCEREEAQRELRVIAQGGHSRHWLLRFLLRANDCAVRAVVYKEPA